MNTNFLLSFDPSIRQTLLKKLQSLKPEGEVSDAEIEQIAKDVVKEELGNSCDTKKLNMDNYLSEMEDKLRGAKLSRSNNSALAVKGIDEGNSMISTDMWIKLGYEFGILDIQQVLEAMDAIENGEKVPDPDILDTEAASKLVGENVQNWEEFYEAFKKNGMSPFPGSNNYNEVLYGLPDAWIEQFFVGPMILYNEDNTQVQDAIYLLDNVAVEQYLGVDSSQIKDLNDFVKIVNSLISHEVNGKIDESISQGSTGDCWLISAVLALNSTDAGKQILNDSMEVNKDGSVTVTFNGVKTADGKPVQYTVTRDEIDKYDTDYNVADSYSNGDNDMLAMELAVEKLEADLYKQKDGIMPSVGQEIITTVEFELPGLAYAQNEDGSFKLDENGQRVVISHIDGGDPAQLLYFLTGNETKTTMAEGFKDDIEREDVMLGSYDGVELSGLSYEQISDLFKKTETTPMAMTFGMYADPDCLLQNKDGSYVVDFDENGNPNLITVREFKDLNGNKFYLELPFTHVVFNDDGTPKLDSDGKLQFTKASAADIYMGHALVITNVDTENQTVSIVNPYDSTDEYTFTWEQFQQMGVFSIMTTELDSPAQEKGSSFDEILNAVPEANKVLTDDIKDILNQIQSGNLEALFDVTLYGVNVADAVLQEDGTFNLEVSLNGASYTFNFPAGAKDELINLGFYTESSANTKSQSVEQKNVDDQVTATEMTTDNAPSGIDNRKISEEFSLDEILDFIGNNSQIWQYIKVIPPQNGAKDPTFKVNTDLIKARFPNSRAITMKDLKEVMLEPNRRAGTRVDDKKGQSNDAPSTFDSGENHYSQSVDRKHFFIK